MSSRSTGGRRVSMAPNRIRRPKRDPNSLCEAEEEANSGRLKNAIFNDEIARLRIREEDLVKVSKEARASAASSAAAVVDDPVAYTRRVAVRKEIPEAERRPPLRRIVLLRRAPPDAPLLCDSDLGRDRRRSGPRLDERGNVVTHSLLGRPEEFYRIGLSRGHLRPQDVPPAYQPEWARAAMDEMQQQDAEASDSARPSRACDSAGSVECRWTPLDLPGVEPGDCAVRPRSSATPARDHNRAVFNGSGQPMRRLTEQLNQCGVASPMKHLTGSCSDLDSSRPASSARSVVLAGPQYSFIGGWSYQKTMLLG